MRKGWFVGSNGNHFHDWGGFRYAVEMTALGYVIRRNGKPIDRINDVTTSEALARAEQISGYAGKIYERSHARD